jgi:hypothetical protein
LHFLNENLVERHQSCLEPGVEQEWQFWGEPVLRSTVLNMIKLFAVAFIPVNAGYGIAIHIVQGVRRGIVFPYVGIRTA